MTYLVELKKSKKPKEWFIRLKHGNGKVFMSSETYKNVNFARNKARLLVKQLSSLERASVGYKEDKK